MEDQIGILEANDSLAITKMKMNQLDEARDYLKLSLEIALKVKSNFYINGCYEVAADLESKAGEYEQAFEYLKLHMMYKDSIMNVEKNNEIVKLKEQYESEKK